MDYPQRFFQQLFAGNRSLELSRRFAIFSGMIFLLIVFLSIMLVWAYKSQGARPYFLYINDNGYWTVYSEKNKFSDVVLPWYAPVQESVATNFMTNYLTITPDPEENNSRLWCNCSGNSCSISWGKCQICCSTNQYVFGIFSKQILPNWQARFANGERFTLENVRAFPTGDVTIDGGLWEIVGDLVSNKNQDKRITGFVKVARSEGQYVDTLGYYVEEFDFYGD
jgi:hypothetical protein